MADEKFVKEIYGKYSKYEIVERKDMLGVKYHIRKDVRYHRGTFKYLRDAVEAAEKEAE